MLKLKGRPLAEVQRVAASASLRIGSATVLGRPYRACSRTIKGCEGITAARLGSPSVSRRVYATMAPPKLETVLASVEDGIGFIKYNRPNNANALGRTTMGDLLKAFTWALDEPEVKVIIYTGEGRFFSAGMDLVGVPADGPVLPDENVERLR